MHIVSLGDNLDEMSDPIFLGKSRKISSVWSAKFAHSMVCDKASTTTEADDILKYEFFSMKISLDFLYELSSKQTIHMKCQNLFLSEK